MSSILLIITAIHLVFAVFQLIISDITDSSLEIRAIPSSQSTSISVVEISGKGLFISPKNETSLFESGALHTTCQITPIFSADDVMVIENDGFLPLRIEVDTAKWEGSVQVKCEVLSAKTNTRVLSKPLGIVLTPAISEVEVVIFHVCLK